MNSSSTIESDHVRCFGVGDGWPTQSRNHSAFLYQIEGNALLIDCGEPLSTAYKASGLSLDLIDRIFISHFHADHIGGLMMFIQGLWLEERKRALTIHMPVDGIEPIRRLLEIGCLFDDLFHFKLDLVPLKAGETIVSKTATVTPFPTSHLRSLKEKFRDRHPVRFEAFCFLIETSGRTIGHTADLGHPDDIAPLLRKPLDLLVCELAHFHPEDMFGMLQSRAIRKILFTHLSDKLWESRSRLQQLAQSKLPQVEVIFPRDGQIELL